jgi:hypothetical protein
MCVLWATSTNGFTVQLHMPAPVALHSTHRVGHHVEVLTQQLRVGEHLGHLRVTVHELHTAEAANTIAYERELPTQALSLGSRSTPAYICMHVHACPAGITMQACTRHIRTTRVKGTHRRSQK